jgi:DNA-binding winged helix-turn-helix (wHTH) protein
MESRSSTRVAQVTVSGPDGSALGAVSLAGGRVAVGRLPETNDIALEPDPELLVTRTAHCALEHEGSHWFVVDGGSVNGTYLRRGGDVRRVDGRTALQDGDVVCVLASSSEERWFELAFEASADSQATRAVRRPERSAAGCLVYDASGARLLLVQGEARHEISIRAQAHRLVGHMAERNAAGGGEPVLCTHDELMHAVWADEPMHTRVELAKLVWELRRKLEPYGAGDLIENERRLGYRIRTCPSP